MKKLFTLILLLSVSLCFVGCKYEKDNESTEDVKINMPVDNSVNSYRTESTDSGLPDIIDGDTVIAGEVSIPDKSNSATYCANKNSKVFHNLECSSVKSIKEENILYFTEREECINNGYTPCKKCNPQADESGT